LPNRSQLPRSHGKSKASSVLALVQFLERKHPDLARKVVGAIHSNVEALTEPEILALAREWFDGYQRGINI